jgi:4-alpha-glucanotransferase
MMNALMKVGAPSTTGGNNWRWRVQAEALAGDLAQRIARLAKIYGR